MRIFTLPPTAGTSAEPNFYDSLQKVRLRQQLEMYSIGGFGLFYKANQISHAEKRGILLVLMETIMVSTGL